ncbi:hypothetical protein CDEST_00569 [Colletotrichum destructivum]|uniref:Uncharacterized protein n=1 Tax=Colletotrichum destructivum TaxID=34406 RepID=A0AAX4HXS1_9PEZI|nr:hypothetical protein CDEST_00569 [Colletotrichum destructivum]
MRPPDAGHWPCSNRIRLRVGPRNTMHAPTRSPGLTTQVPHLSRPGSMDSKPRLAVRLNCLFPSSAVSEVIVQHNQACWRLPN